MLRALSKLRREAGKVRDLDVQRKLLDRAPEQDVSAGEAALERQARKLRRTLKERRDDLAGELQGKLGQRSRSTSRKLEKLMSVLEPAEETVIPTAKITELTRSWFRANVPPGVGDGSNSDSLHSIRKIAKLARYIAESAVAPAGPAQRRPGGQSQRQSTGELAREFETLQQSGGDWHDLLTLSAIARHELGKRDPLTRELDRRCEAALAAYQEQLGHAPA